jgi:predicted Zn-dependent protease with MMP-like domain
MDARSGPGLNDPFEEAIDDTLNSLPTDLRVAMSNVEIVVEDEPPGGEPLLGLYRGVPLPRSSSTYSGVLPDKISIFAGPITRLAAGDAVAYAARSGTSCSMRLRITSGSATSG